MCVCVIVCGYDFRSIVHLSYIFVLIQTRVIPRVKIKLKIKSFETVTYFMIKWVSIYETARKRKNLLFNTTDQCTLIQALKMCYAIQLKNIKNIYNSARSYGNDDFKVVFSFFGWIWFHCIVYVIIRVSLINGSQ